MARGKRHRRGRQPSMWVSSSDLPRSAGHPLYERLNRVLDEAGFDAFVEEQCRQFYADGVGRPSLAPGRYFRMLLLGYFEGLDSERAIAWRAADSLSLRQFLDVSLDEAPPDHSTVSRTRRRIAVESHLAVFTWVLQRLADAGLVGGKTVGIDATTLEANAALRSIVRRDTGAVSNGHSIFPRCGHRKFPHPLLNPRTTTMPVDARGQAVCGLSTSRWARLCVHRDGRFHAPSRHPTPTSIVVTTTRKNGGESFSSCRYQLKPPVAGRGRHAGVRIGQAHFLVLTALSTLLLRLDLVVAAVFGQHLSDMTFDQVFPDDVATDQRSVDVHDVGRGDLCVCAALHSAAKISRTRLSPQRWRMRVRLDEWSGRHSCKP